MIILVLVFDFFFQVLYFGDSNRSDVYPSRCYAGWDTCAVIEEVEAEISPEEFEVNISRAPSTKKRKVEVSGINVRIVAKGDFLTC